MAVTRRKARHTSHGQKARPKQKHKSCSTTTSRPTNDRRGDDIGTTKAPSGFDNQGTKAVPIDLTSDSTQTLIDLTNNSGDEAAHSNSTQAPGCSTKARNTIDSKRERLGKETVDVGNTNEAATRSFPHEEEAGDDTGEPQASAIKSEPLQASLGTVASAGQELVEASTNEPTEVKNSETPLNPTIESQLGQSSTRGAHLPANAAEPGQSVVQVAEEYLKRALEVAIQASEEAEKKLSNAKEKASNAQEEARNAKKDVDKRKGEVRRVQDALTKLNGKGTKRPSKEGIDARNTRPRITPTVLKCEHVPGTSNTNLLDLVEYLTTDVRVVHPPHLDEHHSAAGGTTPLDTRPDASYTGMQDKARALVQRESARTTEEGDQILEDSGDSNLTRFDEAGTTQGGMDHDKILESFKRRIREEVESHGKCHCSRKESSGKSCAVTCSNTATLILCDDETCSLDRSLCQNRWAQDWASEKCRTSCYLQREEDTRCGEGVIWTGPQIRSDEGKRLAEYVGEYISRDEHALRKAKADHVVKGYFAFELKVPPGCEHVYLDSTFRRSQAALFNHCCDSNAEATQYWGRDGIRLMIVSSKTINTGDAITIDYGHAPTEFRVVIGETENSQPVCLGDCGEKCKWPLYQAMQELEAWLGNIPRTWSKGPVPRTIELYLRGASHTIQVHAGHYKPADVETILREACSEVMTILKRHHS